MALHEPQRESRLWGLTVATANLSTLTSTDNARIAARARVAVPARLTWKDATGAVRFASVTTRDLSDTGAFVECAAQAPIPQFRLVHLQLESATPLAAGAGSRILAAVWRVEHASGCPSGYALRFMIDPTRAAAQPAYPVADMAVAS